MRAATPMALPCAGGLPHAAPAAAALGAELAMLRGLLARLAGPAYRAAPSRQSGTIGAHVRHSLDHVRALVRSLHSGDLSYDARLRNTEIEHDPAAAVSEIDRLVLALDDVEPRDLDRTVQLRMQTDRQGTAIAVHSTIGRELAYTIQHTIHHAALIGVLLDQLGIALPPQFGYAPSSELTMARKKAEGKRQKG